ncbi:MAG: response regulator [Bacteroidia bacterium]
MNNKRVIIFEDNTNLRLGLATLIKGTTGFECAGEFANCDNLLENIIETNPDIILMDIEMPGMTSIEAVYLIKEKFPEIKILMETIFDTVSSHIKNIYKNLQVHSKSEAVAKAIKGRIV